MVALGSEDRVAVACPILKVQALTEIRCSAAALEKSIAADLRKECPVCLTTHSWAEMRPGLIRLTDA